MPARTGRMSRRTGRPRRFPIGAVPGLFAALALLGGAAYLAARLDPLPPPYEGVARASDGDSLRLAGVRIRLIGIDAPELDQICWDGGGAEWPCGRASRDRLAAMLEGRPAACAGHGRDKYGRVLATCTVAGRDVGAALVAEGMALSYGDYAAEQARARAAGAGIWQGRFVEPRQWRDEGPSEAPEPSIFDRIWRWFRELTGATSLR